ncbi:hypothetical protein ACLBO2_22675, partial [Klebsiella pneumoniae]
ERRVIKQQEVKGLDTSCYVSVCRKHYKEALSVGSLTKVQNQHRPC